jgi:hypothetical protein
MDDDRSGDPQKFHNAGSLGLSPEQVESKTATLITLNRRKLLGAGSVAAMSGLAGCGSICPREFEAPPATLPYPGNFGLQNGKPQRIEISRDILGERLLINYYSVYQPADNGAIAAVGIFSTPLASCFGQDWNPVTTQEFEKLLVNPQFGGQFVNTVAPQATSTNWQKGPTAFDSWSGTLFDETVPVEAYTGIVGNPQEDLYAVIIAMARHKDANEAVLVGAGTAERLSPEAAPSGFDVVPTGISQGEVNELKQLTLGVLPKIRKQAQSPSAPDQPTSGYGSGGYGQGGYGDISA